MTKTTLMFGKLFCIGVLFVGACAQDNLEDLIKTVFKTSKNTPDFPFTDNETQKSKKSCGFGQECIQAYLCSNGHTNTDGATLINVRFGEDDTSECSFAETCCPVDSIVTEPIVKPSTIATGCGYRNIDGVGFKIEGSTDEAEFGEFPWMLAILRCKTDFCENRNIYQCGGSLIHPKVVLTGAHCVHSKPMTVFKVRAGEWDTNSKTELHPDQDRLVVDMVLHEKYNSSNLYNDVALLFLESPFDLAPNVNTLCLPPAGFNFDFSRCYATGWGKDNFQNGQYHNILKKIELPVVPSYVCQDNLRKTRLGRHFQLHWSFACAGGERGKDTCQGDGGSPLVCPIDNQANRYYQAGIVAWGIGCAEEDIPGVYVNVAQFRTWIDEQLTLRGIYLPDSKV